MIFNPIVCLLGLALLDYTWTMKMYSYWVYQKRHLASEIAYSDFMDQIEKIRNICCAAGCAKVSLVVRFLDCG